VRVSLPPNCSEKHLLGAILENVELDSSVYSDGWKAYNKLSLNGFHHRRINQGLVMTRVLSWLMCAW